MSFRHLASLNSHVLKSEQNLTFSLANSTTLRYINNRTEEMIEVGTARTGKLEPLRVEFFNAAMRPLLNKLRVSFAFNQRISPNITKGQIYQSYMAWKAGQGFGNNGGWQRGQLSIAGIHSAFGALLSLAMANDLLRDHGVAGFYKQLKRFESDPKSHQRNTPRQEIVRSTAWSALMKKTEIIQASGEHVHPKLIALYEVLRRHFDMHDQGERAAAGTRVIVFAQFRNSVTGIVNYLEAREEKRVKQENERIKQFRAENSDHAKLRRRVRICAHKFVGQSNGSSDPTTKDKDGSKRKKGAKGRNSKTVRKKKSSHKGRFYREEEDSDAEGFVDSSAIAQAAADAAESIEKDREANMNNEDRGMNQKRQESVVKGFKNGTFNVLVSTSIGEEGLDIGQVDCKCCCLPQIFCSSVRCT